MSLKHCKNCKKETEHRRSGKSVGVLVATFLLMALFSKTPLFYAMAGVWVYFFYSSKKCVECKS